MTCILFFSVSGGGSTVADKLAFAEIERCSEVATFKPAMELHEEELLHMLRLSGLPFVEKQVDVSSLDLSLVFTTVKRFFFSFLLSKYDFLKISQL